MTQEDKELLLKDLSARLPYEVKLDNGLKLRSIDVLTQIVSCSGSDRKIDYVKPYLRPLYSMTEEEKREFYKVVFDSVNIDNISSSAYVADWQYSKHFDVHGLIPKGLAIEVTEQNNPYKD